MFNDNNFFGGGGAGFYSHEIEQSLRFNDDDSAYLSWTPASAGNRKTWTFSTWVKRGNLGSYQVLFGAGSSTSNRLCIRLDVDKLYVFEVAGGSTVDNVGTNAVFRDPSSWYHVTVTYNSTESTSTDRIKIYVNGELQTSLASTDYPSLDYNGYVNLNASHFIGMSAGSTQYLDGYLAETHFIDGTAYDATAFGEFKNGVWIPKTPDVTYGTNGFYLPYRNDYTVEGFSTVTYKGNGGTDQYIGGVGFSPDLVWVKGRSTDNHNLYDSIRGEGYYLQSDSTGAESYLSNALRFENDGFTVGHVVDNSSIGYVAWCWDAGSGSPVSNTDGSITSTVKANPSRGFSIVSYTGTGNVDTVGHGLSSGPELVIIKDRDAATNWLVLTTSIDGSVDYLALNSTSAAANAVHTITSSSFGFAGASSTSNTASRDYIAYCFHSVSGYSKMGSYTGNSSVSGPTVTLGFRPAFVIIKNVTTAKNWNIHDTTRDTDSLLGKTLFANLSDSETDYGGLLTITDTGFQVTTLSSAYNTSGDTYIYMAFADTREAAFWLDDSGNNNDWENNGLTESDISLDSPTNNFATLNPLDTNSAVAMSEGNTEGYSASYNVGTRATAYYPATGKWYYEGILLPTVGGESMFGCADSTWNKTYLGSSGNTAGLAESGSLYTSGSVTGTISGTGYSEGDVIGIAYDTDTGEVDFYVNNTLNRTATFPSGTEVAPAISIQNGASVVNFGQDSSFAGNKTPQGYTDANGRGDFYYAPPAGYLALCTANLPEPAIGPNSATTADENFTPILWTGTGTTVGDTYSLTGLGFQPDLIWVKARSSAYGGPAILDAIRGDDKILTTYETAAEYTSADPYDLQSFDADGFTFGYGGYLLGNTSGVSNVAWSWKADNTSGSTNTDGTITSTVAANVDAGFSIVSYTGTGSAATVGHGLNSAPDMVIVKNRSDVRNWLVYSGELGGTKYLELDTTVAAGTSSGIWNNTNPTSSVFSIGTAPSTNGSGNNMIAYCFHSVDGYSKLGSYTGNGSTDGPYVHLGFRPAFFMMKRTDSTGNWLMYDDTRQGYNLENDYLHANYSNAEADGGTSGMDFLSNGIKLRNTYNDTNASGGTYIYMAFAENPFKYSNAR